MSLDGLYLADCMKLSMPISDSIKVSRKDMLKKLLVSHIFSQVEKDVKEFMVVNKSDLEDRMDVEIWTKKVNAMDNVMLKECPYNMDELLGKWIIIFK